MKTRYALAFVSLVLPAAALLPGCEGESLSKAIPKTEDRLNDYALTQIYMVPIASGMPLDADSLKSQIDTLVGQYGEEQVVDKIKEIATDHDDPAYRAAAVFSSRAYLSAADYNALEAGMDDAAREALAGHTQ